MRADIQCPKCSSQSTWYSRTHTDLLLHCVCGYQKVVFTTLEDLQVEHRVTEVKPVLPRQGSNLWLVLTCLWSISRANSREITDTLVFRGHGFSVSDVSSCLMILSNRGLVDCVVYNRGSPGGSTWKLTDAASTLLGD